MPRNALRSARTRAPSTCARWSGNGWAFLSGEVLQGASQNRVIRANFRIRFANGESTCVRIVAARCARALPSTSRPLQFRGRRESRMHAAPAVSCAMEVVEDAHEHTGPAETSDFPCAAVYGLYMLSSVSPALLPPSSARERELDTSHWGVGTTRLRRPLQMPSSVAPSASTASPPRAGTLRNAPSSGTGCETYNPVLNSGKQNYFLREGLDSIFR